MSAISSELSDIESILSELVREGKIIDVLGPNGKFEVSTLLHKGPQKWGFESVVRINGELHTASPDLKPLEYIEPSPIADGVVGRYMVNAANTHANRCKLVSVLTMDPTQSPMEEGLSHSVLIKMILGVALVAAVWLATAFIPFQAYNSGIDRITSFFSPQVDNLDHQQTEAANDSVAGIERVENSSAHNQPDRPLSDQLNDQLSIDPGAQTSESQPMTTGVSIISPDSDRDVESGVKLKVINPVGNSIFGQENYLSRESNAAELESILSASTLDKEVNDKSKQDNN